MAARIAAKELSIDAQRMPIRKMFGPLGSSGGREWGILRIPRKIIKQRFTDMARI
jgi:hypothetical protein